MTSNCQRCGKQTLVTCEECQKHLNGAEIPTWVRGLLQEAAEALDRPDLYDGSFEDLIATLREAGKA